jgi:hypothetical protein
MLAQAIGAKELAAHAPDEIPWNNLETPVIVAMHWRQTPEFREFLTRRGFETIVIVRNPLDILISILRFSQHEPATAQWLAGEGGDESVLRGVDPASPQFLEYALSTRASLLLHVSAEWQAPAREVLRYEDLVADPEGTLDLAVRSLNCKSVMSSREVERAHTPDFMKSLSPHHFWKGEPGIWRRLIPADYRRAIYDRYADLFELWNFDCPDDFPLSREQAKANWKSL